LKVLVAEVPTWAKLLQAAPPQRSIKYWLTVPPLSVEAAQERLIWVPEAAVAAKFVGAVGDVVPAGGVVGALAPVPPEQPVTHSATNSAKQLTEPRPNRAIWTIRRCT
jgi:hypothetical protein